MTPNDLLRALPKVELHVHIEGTLEPELAFQLASKHELTMPYADAADLRRAYNFSDLQSFLDLYYAGCSVLRDADDFYALGMAYFARAHADGVVHAELFFDPQTHTARGVTIGTVFDGLGRARRDAAYQFGITSELILCFLRHLPEADADATLTAAEPFLSQFVGVGLDSSERDFPPALFARVFARAARLGLRRVAHAGEEGPAAYIQSALDELGAERIDHGVRCEEDPMLLARLRRERVPLTVCPLSNLKLRVVPSLREHNLARLLRAGLCVSIHSDDPSYFGGYLGDNYRACQEAFDFSPAELAQLARNAVEAAFLPPDRKLGLLEQIDELVATRPASAD